MSKKPDLVQILAGVGLGFWAAASHAQATIDEITELNRQKVIADLRKQLDAAKPQDKAVAAPRSHVIRSTAPPPKEEPPPPEVNAIFGLRPDALMAFVSVQGGRPVRTVVGDITATGWVVERITSTYVTFRRSERVVSKVGGKEVLGEPQVQRIDVALSTPQRAPAVAATQPMPMPPLAFPTQGIGYAQPMPMMQAPQALPAPVPARQN